MMEEGLCLGLSSGINVAGAVALARELGPGKTVVTMLCDSGLRYLSTRSEEHTSELQSLMRISYAVFCLKKKKTTKEIISTTLYNLHTTRDRIQHKLASYNISHN